MVTLHEAGKVWEEEVKPFVIICFTLADVIAKVPVADLIAKFMADLIAMLLW